VFLGSITVSYDNRHLAMDLFLRMAPASVQRAIEVLTLVMLVGFCGFVFVQAWTIVALMARVSQVSIAAGIPMTIPYSAFVVGFGLIAVGAVAGAYVRWRTARAGQSPE
jgi:TRAP-type C4-dicarboxylate transport system permease small subunit